MELCATNMKLELDDSFNFHLQSLTGPSRSSSRSSLSSLSSFSNPFTPCSDHSTPQNRSMCMEPDHQQFSSMSSFDMSPPSSTASNLFTDMKVVSPASVHDGPPSTPSRFSHALDMSAVPYNRFNQLTPSHNNDYYGFDGVSSSPSFMISTPSHSIPSTHGGDMTCVWSTHGDSPITFMDKRASPHGPVVPTLMSIGPARQQEPANNNGHHPDGVSRRLFEQARQRTTALQQAQQTVRVGRLRVPGKKEKTPRTVMTPHGLASVIPRAQHKCDFPGCGGKVFKRKEHLLRHQDTTHKIKPEDYVQCVWCQQKFNRRDNWRQHLSLHSNPNRNSTRRLGYFPEAAKQYAEEMKRIKNRRGKVKQRPTAVQIAPKRET